MALVSEIRQYLIDNGVAAAGNIFEGKMPPSPDSCVVLYPFRGFSPERAMTKASVVDRPKLIVHCRATKLSTAMSAALSVQSTLDDVGGIGITLSGVRYLDIKAEGSPEFLGRDDDEREIVVQDYAVVKDR